MYWGVVVTDRSELNTAADHFELTILKAKLCLKHPTIMGSDLDSDLHGLDECLMAKDVRLK